MKSANWKLWSGLLIGIPVVTIVSQQAVWIAATESNRRGLATAVVVNAIHVISETDWVVALK